MIRKINDKGIAMEVAIVALLIIFALCSVLLTMAEIGVYSNKRNAETVGDRILRTKIVDDCMVAIRNDQTAALITSLNENYTDYEFTSSQGEKSTYLFVFEKDPQQLVLTIQFDTVNGDVLGYYAADHLPDGVSAPPPPTPEPTPTPTPAA